MTDAPRLEQADRLRSAPMEVVGRFADASNATLLARLTDRDPRDLDTITADLGHAPGLEDLDPDDLVVYKPRRGERPLWDFPQGTLHRREVAAAEVSAALGWDLVPTTVLRDEGPFGVGSVQRFVPHDPEQHYFTVVERDDDALRAQLVAMVLFDLAIDNADRKGGHVLVEPFADEPARTPRLHLVDHGVSFNVVDKLRTVAWDLAGTPVPDALRADLARLRTSLDGAFGDRCRDLLSDAEVAVFATRVERATQLEVLPEPVGDVPYPWPLL
ncbi:MAG: SCO1664 family protein [Nitriliruptoraceae bacterium]|nr:SCO1664 family protein [Nitriliruptoraceae bacterium]